MPKAILSNRIYMDLPHNKEEIFQALTYKIDATKHLQHGSKQHTEIIRNYRMISPTIMSLPQGRLDLIPSHYEIIDKRVLEFADFPAPIHQLFDDQKIVYDQVDTSCFINALPGWGKTFCALHIAAKLGQKTLVVTHTTALRDQWIVEVEKLFSIKPGVIGSGTFTTNSPIVVANVQSLVLCMDRVAKMFGTIIMDEAHHTPATTFTKVINECHARYRIALSGTMQRKDGKHVLFPDYFGPTVFRPPQNNTVNPKVLLLKTNIKLPYGKTWADKVTGLLSDPSYVQFIAATALVQAQKGHKVLIIADRVQFLQSLERVLEGKAVSVVGETKDRAAEIQKLIDGEVDIIAGSRQIFSEGISVNMLSCLILATPIANPATLEQVIGRIMRLYPDKLEPIVVDLQFAGHTERRQNSDRIGFYMSKGWEMVQI